jgi:outer membrane protein assembly factor BamB
MVIAYRIDQKSAPPISSQSFGRIRVQPLVTYEDAKSSQEYVVWSTERGHLNFCRVIGATADALLLKYRLETGAPIVARPAYLPPDPKAPVAEKGVVFAGSRDGFVYAVREETGDTLWRFSAGQPIDRSPVVVDDRLYVTTEFGGMYCLEAKTSKNLWWAPGIMQFVAAGKDRVYAVDGSGRLLTLSAADGAQLDAMPTENVSMKLTNADTDRIYLISDRGLIQCLHEIGQTEPLEHGKDRKEAAKKARQTVEGKPAEKKIDEGRPPPKKEPAASKQPAPRKEKPASKGSSEKGGKKSGNEAASGN